MRQIKFRVWSEGRKKWLNECMFDMEVRGAYDFSSDASMRYNYKTDVVVEQYTGLKDKNGVEVYEGDVVKYLTHTAHVFWSPQDFGFVHYNEVIGGYAGLSFFTGYKGFEVVGNIHQHPELLEQKQ